MRAFSRPTTTGEASIPDGVCCSIDWPAASLTALTAQPHRISSAPRKHKCGTCPCWYKLQHNAAGNPEPLNPTLCCTVPPSGVWHLAPAGADRCIQASRCARCLMQRQQVLPILVQLNGTCFADVSWCVVDLHLIFFVRHPAWQQGPCRGLLNHLIVVGFALVCWP